jgi:hypothetical protein
MPVKLEWHPSLPVLVAAYSGVLSSAEYYAMCDRRKEMLKSKPERVVLLADMRQLEAFPDAGTTRLRENVLMYKKVFCTLIVLPTGLYRALTRHMLAPADPSHRVRFFEDLEAALAHARSALSSQ